MDAIKIVNSSQGLNVPQDNQQNAFFFTLLKLFRIITF